ncbi:phosphatidate cytidylyltransferase [Schaalia sp. Marseille-Q2122]|uniref:phosphatidate cytidylyltransferase n=1 Tax=Schaalia sp. Marseille-Q2122 TaxID=2736604 RepID=UPI00158CEF40|nr:phosphatidate cytidylyltransferase [Schaalia sp. Marseille-Q2122]
MSDSSIARVVGKVLSPAPTVERPPLPATGRAGRNLPAAVGTAAVLIVALASSLIFFTPLFVVFAAVMCVAAVWELAGAFARVGIHLSMPPIYLGTIGILTCAWMLGVEATLVATYLTVFAAIAWRLVDSTQQTRMHDIVASVFTIVYVPFFAAFLLLMLREFNSAWIVGLLVLLAVMNDLGGWAAGIMFGKHPMAPRLSPKKSWEGFAGSLAASIIAGVICLSLLGAHWWWGVIAGIAGAFIGTLGDLLESLIKREVGLKDMSALLPGHGGVLDRIDALLMYAPVFYFIVRNALGA